MKPKTEHIIIIVVLFLLFTDRVSSQEMWGMTASGGNSYLGTIFKTDNQGNNHSIEYTAINQSNGEHPTSDLFEASNGMLYGTTSDGGQFNRGVIFEYNPITSVIDVKVDMNYSYTGVPSGGLIQALNGKLYGLSKNGGSMSGGTLFKYDINSGLFEIKHNFAWGSGKEPVGSLLLAANGKLYGMTKEGGANNKGVIFEFNVNTNMFYHIANFSSQIGFNPSRSLIEVSDGCFYGLTCNGGAENRGVLFKFTIETKSIQKKIDFGENPSIGHNPKGDLVEGANGKLYGMTFNGGQNDLGVLFEYNPATNNIEKIVDFDGNNGGKPYGSLEQSSDGMLYGMTSKGGVDDNGVLFKYDINTGIFTKTIDFVNDIGILPKGNLINASDGKCWGMTYAGGSANKGTIFEYNPTQNQIETKFNFEEKNDGSYFSGNLLYIEPEMLFGMAPHGGDYDQGVLFGYNRLSGTYTKIIDFDSEITGSFPYGSLIKAPNGKLYGMTSEGGTFNKGVLFEFNPPSNEYVIKFEFDSINNGSKPMGSLLLADNGKMYGLTYSGGNSNDGVVFEYDYNQSIYNKLDDFDSQSTGTQSYGSLIQASNGKLYGMTSRGGFFNYGVLFEFDISTSVISNRFNFNIYDGAIPMGDLVQFEGLFYGLTRVGGGGSMEGSLFMFNISTNEFQNKVQFNVGTGYYPEGNLLVASNNKFYGMTKEGGPSYGKGTIFEYDPKYEIFQLKYDFHGSNGAWPIGSLIEIPTIVNDPEIKLEISVMMFPNPTNDIVAFNFRKSFHKINVEIVDIHGNSLIYEEFSFVKSLKIDIADLKKGLYIVMLNLNGNLRTLKMIKN